MAIKALVNKHPLTINIVLNGLVCMKKIFNFFFGRIICAYVGHQKYVIAVKRPKKGEPVVYWECERCKKNNLR
jgi:hypothetical protein